MNVLPGNNAKYLLLDATRILEYQQEIQRLKQELGKLRMHDGHTPMKH